ncbi:MAG: hypothetical protein ACRD2X_05590 [Vicinamibacteraceae bacterium]
MRLEGESLEMPGLDLSVPQAMRLFGLEEEVCRAALTMLARRGFLVRTASGTYRRAEYA